MPASHELADLIHEFNNGENTILCSSMSDKYARICSYFAMAGIPFMTVPQDTERIIVVLADEKSWKPVFDMATNFDDTASIRMILDYIRGIPKAGSFDPVCDEDGHPVCDEEGRYFQVILHGLKDRTMKISVIKAIRMIKSMGLKEAKELVDAVEEGRTSGVERVIFEGSSLLEANRIAADLAAAGAMTKIHSRIVPTWRAGG